LLGSGPALALLASRALVAWAGSWRRAASDGTWPGFLFAAWFFGLLVATPNYHPYARLTLPLVASFWLGAGWFAAWFFRDESETKVLVETSNGGEAPPACPIVASEGRWRPTLAFAGFALALVLAAPRLGDADVPAWRDRSDLRRGALALFETAYADLMKNSSMSRPGAVFLTYGEPAVYLALSDDARFATWDELVLAPTGEVPRRPAEQAVFLITGPHAEHDAAFQQALQPGQVPRLELVAARSFAPSDVLLLDQKDPRQVVGGRSAERMELRCYRVFFSAKD
jgi:hypothetical protein